MTPDADAHTYFPGEKHGEDGEMDKTMRPGDAAAVVLSHTLHTLRFQEHPARQLAPGKALSVEHPARRLALADVVMRYSFLGKHAARRQATE